MTTNGGDDAAIAGATRGDELSVLLPEVVVSTSDPRVAARAVEPFVGSHQIVVREPGFHASVLAGRLADLGLAMFTYEAGLTIDADPLSTFALNFSLRGSAAVDIAGQEVIASRGAGVLFRPGAPSRLRWSADLRTLTILIPADALDRHLVVLTSPARVRLDLRSDVPPERAQRILSVLLSGLRVAQSDGRMPPEQAVWHFRDALLSSVLLELQDEQHPARGPENTSAAAIVGDAASAMRRLLADAPSIPYIAASIGTTERNLQASFRDEVGSTPSAYFKRLRLEAVRDALLRSSPAQTSVTQVASETAGFFHLGRFAGEYLREFGEHPRDTLRRRASR